MALQYDGNQLSGKSNEAVPQAVVFDAYGTLFDVSAVASVAERWFPGNGEIISRIWRQKQLEYSWLYSLMGRYVDFKEINRDAITYALHHLQKTSTPEAVEKLAHAYLELPLHPEARAALSRLSLKKLVLSNGTEEMLLGLLDNASVKDYFSHVLSADMVHIYKPSPNVYELVTNALGIAANRILFVSSNGWDVAGSKSFGFQTVWVNRDKKTSEELGVVPDFTVESLLDIARLVEGLQ